MVELIDWKDDLSRERGACVIGCVLFVVLCALVVVIRTKRRRRVCQICCSSTKIINYSPQHVSYSHHASQ